MPSENVKCDPKPALPEKCETCYGVGYVSLADESIAPCCDCQIELLHAHAALVAERDRLREALVRGSCDLRTITNRWDEFGPSRIRGEIQDIISEVFDPALQGARP